MATHEVFNQPPALENYNLFTSDSVLRDAVVQEGATWAVDDLTRFGALLGLPETQRLGFEANDYPPVLRTHDRFGHRIDEVDYHPSYYELMRISVEFGLHSGPWAPNAKPGAHVARAAKMYLMSQVEFGHLCPISMTYSVVPALRRQPDLAGEWEPRITTTAYDKRFLPASQKKGVILGMAMTEKQGGSDVRANTSKAVPLGKGGPGQEYALTGHKWFCSAPMSDAFLVLAQAPGGLSCFLLPRWKPDGTKNNFFVQRLKNKVGNRSNASSEIEFENAWARMVGEEGRGVPTIIEMVNHTRLDCVIGSAALMRQAVAQLLHHASHRNVFGKKMTDQPLMQNVLADLSVESEAAAVLTMRLAHAYDHRDDHFEDAFRRIATAVAKYWICKRAPFHIYEALEGHGGSGFVEESILSRLYREAPVNSVWEGSGNVIALDVLRAAQKEPKTLEALVAEIKKASDIRLDHHLDRVLSLAKNTPFNESQARRLVEGLALALQASLLLRRGHPAVTEAFLASRLGGEGGLAFGTLPASVDCKAIIERAKPAI